jgi:mRNA-degrading endonuclease YafQ of YafQ-DinJ toxin-antitoxin module
MRKPARSKEVQRISAETGICIDRVKNFFSRNPELTQIEKFEGTMRQRRAFVDKALANLGQSNSLFTYYYEHYLNHMWKGSRDCKMNCVKG